MRESHTSKGGHSGVSLKLGWEVGGVSVKEGLEGVHGLGEAGMLFRILDQDKGLYLPSGFRAAPSPFLEYSSPGSPIFSLPLPPFKSLLKCPSVRGLSQPPFIKGPVPSPPSLCSMGFTPQGQGLCFCSLLHRELRTVPGAEQTLHRYTFVELNERSGSGKLLEVYTNTNNSKCNLGINRW